MSSFLPIAIRSLQCPDHAANIPPRVLSLLWFLGKRCNYDCSYCSPHTHDAVSPYINIDDSKRFSDSINAYCQQEQKKVKWAFSGGEPFIDPNFLNLAEHISQMSSHEQMNVTTNGSLPLDVYLRAAEVFKGITISVHLERSKKEIDNTLKKIVEINKKCFISVNLMFLPGKKEWVKEIIDYLQINDISFILRKITPIDVPTNLLPYTSTTGNRKDQILIDVDQQVQKKILFKQIIDQQREQKIKDFYTEDEKKYLVEINQVADWQNCGVWTTDNRYLELNSDYLVANDLVNFKGWICYAGVDNLYVDFNGSIYRALCQNDGAIGHISKGITFQTAPTVCKKQWCTCNIDIPIRKSLPENANLVT